MNKHYIKLNLVDKEWLNSLIYNHYVVDENGNFKPGFTSGVNYFDVNNSTVLVDSLIQSAVNDSTISADDRNKLSTLLATQYTKQQCIDNGWVMPVVYPIFDNGDEPNGN